MKSKTATQPVNHRNAWRTVLGMVVILSIVHPLSAQAASRSSGGVRSGGVRSGGVRSGGVHYGGVHYGGSRSSGVYPGGARPNGVYPGGVRPPNNRAYSTYTYSTYNRRVYAYPTYPYPVYGFSGAGLPVVQLHEFEKASGFDFGRPGYQVVFRPPVRGGGSGSIPHPEWRTRAGAKAATKWEQ
jgi:hypothetical protein